jgi:hypothetical protein
MTGTCLLYGSSIPVTEQISITVPTVGDILDHEDDYYAMVSMLTAMPIDFMVQLDDMGVDFTTINDYELFLILFGTIREMDTRLIFGDLDLKRFELAKHIESGMPVIYDEADDIVIDRVVQTKIATTLREIHHLEKDVRKPGNQEAKEYLLERARKKLKRRKRRKEKSQLQQLIVAMVNTEQFKYDFRGVRDLTIYQFNESVRQIQHKIDYDNKMHGIYAGTVDPKKINQDDLNWLIHK